MSRSSHPQVLDKGQQLMEVGRRPTGLTRDGETYHSGRVTSVSMTVPGGGLAVFPPMLAKNLVAMRFFTTTTLSLGLWSTGKPDQVSGSLLLRGQSQQQHSHVVLPQSPDGFLDLSHLEVDHAQQLAVPHTVPVDDDA